MQGQRINAASAKVLVALTLLALLTVLSGYMQPPQTDEGTAAHIFQLSIAAIVLVFLIFFTTADWTRPLRSARALVIPVAALVVAFAALFYLEHYR